MSFCFRAFVFSQKRKKWENVNGPTRYSISSLAGVPRKGSIFAPISPTPILLPVNRRRRELFLFQPKTRASIHGQQKWNSKSIPCLQLLPEIRRQRIKSIFNSTLVETLRTFTVLLPRDTKLSSLPFSI